MNTYSRQGSERAARVLEQLNLTTPRDVPIDAAQVAEDLGIDVYTADLDNQGLDGFVLLEPGGARAEITINSTQSRNRRRFTCAHELGHVMQEQESGDPTQEIGFVDNDGSLADSNDTIKELRDEKSRLGTSPKELYANAFAASLLMPERVVRTVHEFYDVPTMARYFEVSEDAMRYRVQNLGLS